mgnify:CR=1 FL=1
MIVTTPLPTADAEKPIPFWVCGKSKTKIKRIRASTISPLSTAKRRLSSLLTQVILIVLLLPAIVPWARFEDAKKEAERAIELNPNDSEAYYILWTVTGADVDSKYIKKALEINPNLSVAYNDLGYIYYAKGNYEKAGEYLKRAIELNPDLLQAHTNLGLTLATQKRFDEAEKEYRKAIEINPDYLFARYTLELF